ncbi:apolipoprotein N-acyltransferase [Luminiphilus sp.]|nr:apolipoprotein N-acyltransferase [Luminiphilus sp.]
MVSLRTRILGFALLAGMLFPLGLSPTGFWPLIPLSAGALFALLEWQRSQPAFRIGYLYGIGFFGAAVSWVYVSIHTYGATPAWLAITLTLVFCSGLALFFGAQLYCFQRLSSQHAGWRVIQFASLWVLFEWLRSWVLTGFPWGYAGYGAIASPVSGWAPLLGVYGCSWLLIAMGCTWVMLLRRPRVISQWAISLGMTGFILLSGQLFTTVTWTKALGDPLTVAIVQPAVPLAKKWSRGHRRDILSDLALTTEPLYATHDLIVWPESALPGYRDQMQGFLTSIHTQAAAHDATVITGIPSRDNEGRYNSIEALGRGSGIYHKQKLVPFGEYIPFEPWLRGVIGFFDLPMSQFSPGPPGQAPLVIDDLAIAPFICYEIVYPDFVAASSKGSQLLVTISNDTWFGNSIGPWQHFQMARFRAVELGRDLIRGTNDGVSAIISAKGEVVSTAPQFTQAVVSGQVQPRSGHTPYAISGSLPILIFSLIGLLLGRDPQ